MQIFIYIYVYIYNLDYYNDTKIWKMNQVKRGVCMGSPGRSEIYNTYRDLHTHIILSNILKTTLDIATYTNC